MALDLQPRKTHPGAGLSRLAIAVVVLLPNGLDAQERDLTSLSLAELSTLQVVTVSKSESRLRAAPAAVSVLTADDIRRSGCTSIPDLLRLVPGLNVAQIDAGTWAVSSRGFNGRFANKMLVLIDGRSVYTSMFSGVYWERVRVNLDDIEQIEVIRGPGATLWGANAVNGVVNIITRDPGETIGALATTAVGTEQRGFGEFRYGDRIGPGATYRVSGQIASRGETRTSNDSPGGDDWLFGQGSLKVNWLPTSRTTLTLQGDINTGNFSHQYSMSDTVQFRNYVAPGALKADGWNVLTRMEHVVSPRSEISAQVFVDRHSLVEPIVNTLRHTYDGEFQHRLRLGERHEFVWGTGVRLYHDDTHPSIISFAPQSSTTHLLNLFIQDDLQLSEEINVTLGSKYEHNSYSGSEWQPNARLVWAPSESFAWWGALSRAMRTPSRVEEEGQIVLGAVPATEGGPNPLPILLVTKGSDRFKSEELRAFETGVRAGLHTNLTADVSLFYNHYENLRLTILTSPELVTTGAQPYLKFPLVVRNGLRGASYGLEVALDCMASSRQRFQLTYAFNRVDIESGTIPDDIVIEDPRHAAGEEATWERTTPRHSAVFRSATDISRRTTMDASIRYVGRINWSRQNAIDDYLALDLRAGWRPVERLELHAAARNLFADGHEEFRSEVFYPYIYMIEQELSGGFRIRF